MLELGVSFHSARHLQMVCLQRPMSWSTHIDQDIKLVTTTYWASAHTNVVLNRIAGCSIYERVTLKVGVSVVWFNLLFLEIYARLVFGYFFLYNQNLIFLGTIPIISVSLRYQYNPVKFWCLNRHVRVALLQGYFIFYM